MEKHCESKMSALGYAPEKSCATETLITVEETPAEDSLLAYTEKDSTNFAEV